MKKIVSFVFVLLLGFMVVACDSSNDETPVEGIEFEIIEDEAVILSYTGTESNLVLPNTIGGTPVTTIDTDAFLDNVTLKSIIIGQYVTSIGSRAFSGARALTTVTFEEGSQLTSIGANAFYNASRLRSINIPSSVTSIGVNAFYNASALTSINIPSSVTSIGADAFYNPFDSVSQLIIYTEHEEIPLGWDSSWNSSNRPVYLDVQEVIDDGMLKYAISSNNTVSILSLSKSVANEIDLMIPGYIDGKEVIQIVNYAFNYETKLLSINIPSSVTTIGNHAFFHTPSLTTVTFEEGSQLTSIGHFAFYNASALTSINIPSSVTSIGVKAFSNTSALTTVTFEEGSQLTSIGDSAFYYASALTSINIPSSVISIGNQAFERAYSITINVEASEKPSGWHSNWNSSNQPVNWGYIKD